MLERERIVESSEEREKEVLTEALRVLGDSPP